MTTIITWADYPHIITAVLGYADPSELLKWRLVSRAFRLRVDRLQCAHLILTASKDPKTTNKTKRRRAPQRQPKLDTVEVSAALPAWGECAVPTPRIAGLREIGSTSWSQLPEHPNLSLTSATRVLDINGFVPPKCNLALLASAFPALQILRMRTSPKGSYKPYLPVPAATVVLFTNSQGEGPNDDFDFFEYESDYEDEEPEVVPDGVRCGLPEGTLKLVVNMKGNDVPIADLFPAALDPPKSLRELVIVMPKYKRGAMRGFMPGVFMDRIIAMDTAEIIMNYHDEDCTITIVGSDEVLPGYTRHLKAILDNHIRTNYQFKGIDPPGAPVILALGQLPHVEHDVYTPAKNPAKNAKVKEILDPIKFVTRAEYIQRVGMRVAELETVERL